MSCPIGTSRPHDQSCDSCLWKSIKATAVESHPRRRAQCQCRARSAVTPTSQKSDLRQMMGMNDLALQLTGDRRHIRRDMPEESRYYGRSCVASRDETHNEAGGHASEDGIALASEPSICIAVVTRSRRWVPMHRQASDRVARNALHLCTS